MSEGVLNESSFPEANTSQIEKLYCRCRNKKRATMGALCFSAVIERIIFERCLRKIKLATSQRIRLRYFAACSLALLRSDLTCATSQRPDLRYFAATTLISTNMRGSTSLASTQARTGVSLPPVQAL